jgi:2-(1,2-epoxy-1,2-dihydrophenyl)acetyl-CoA isomerase
MNFYQNEFTHLKANLKENILTVTLDRADSSNAITYPMIDSIETVMSYADADDNVDVIILTGTGKNFCAGGDIKDMKEKKGMFKGEPNELRIRYKDGIQRIPKIMDSISKPVIAMINGAAMGAGLDLACMCDIRVCERNSKFGETFAKLGLVPGDGGSYFLQRIVGFSKAMEMSLTAGIYNSEQGYEMKLVNKVVESGELQSTALEFAKQISSNSSSVIPMIKKSIQHAYRNDLASSLELLAAFQGIAQRTDEHFEALDRFNQRSNKK